MSKLRIAIIGAGLGGLTLASAITFMDEDRKIEVDVYEAVPELAEIGAGINLWPRTYQLLSKIGLRDDVLRHCEQAKKDSSLIFEFRKSDQPNGFKILNMYDEGGLVRIHRADLQRILLDDATKRCRLHLSSKLVSYTEHEDSVQMVFENGSTGTCDLLIGADGVKSVMRRLFLANQPGDGYKESIDPVWSGSCAYRGIISREELFKKFPGHRAAQDSVMYVGKNKHVVVYPMSEGRYINVGGYVFDSSKEDTRFEGSSSSDISQDDLFSVFEHWEPEVQALLQCIPKPTKWTICHLRPLKTFGNGRVLLLGDSAHAMTPHTGSGAGQAMEDAYVLAHILTRSSIAQLNDHVPFITQTYDAIRRPMANAELKMSVTCGKLLGLIDEDGDLGQVEDGDEEVPHEVLVKFINKIQTRWRSPWKASLDEECEKSSKLLQELVN
ncbi:salicylate hydroxylase [Amanita muscaria]